MAPQGPVCVRAGITTHTRTHTQREDDAARWSLCQHTVSPCCLCKNICQLDASTDGSLMLRPEFSSAALSITSYTQPETATVALVWDDDKTSELNLLAIGSSCVNMHYAIFILCRTTQLATMMLIIP